MFAALTQWTLEEGYDQAPWSVSPSNVGGVNAYLSYGARITGWIDNAYGIASDAFYTGTTDRFRGTWKPSWPESRSTTDIDRNDLAALREALLSGQHIVSATDAEYELVAPL